MAAGADPATLLTAESCANDACGQSWYGTFVGAEAAAAVPAGSADAWAAGCAAAFPSTTTEYCSVFGTSLESLGLETGTCCDSINVSLPLDLLMIIYNQNFNHLIV